MHAPKSMLWLAVLLLVTAVPASAQKPAAKNKKDKPVVQAVGNVPEPKLVFEREVFSYPAGGRRDPFAPPVTPEELGPRFEDLNLRGIIFSPESDKSVALVADGNEKVYRLRRGGVVGNARVIEISQKRVLFAVETLGVVRQEELSMKREPQGAVR